MKVKWDFGASVSLFSNASLTTVALVTAKSSVLSKCSPSSLLCNPAAISMLYSFAVFEIRHVFCR